MRHVISIPLMLLISACSTPASENNEAGAGTELASGDIPSGALREKFDDNPQMEKITINDASGHLSAQGTVLNGKKEGSWTEFYTNGSVKSVTPFVDGKKEGCYVELNNNGQFVKRISFHNNLRHGEYKEFNYSNLKEMRFYQNDKLEDTVKIYYDNGKVMELGCFKNGTRNGISRWYDQEGKL